MAMLRSFMAEAGFTGCGRAKRGRCPLVGEGDGNATARRTSPRSADLLCGAIHEKEAKGKGNRRHAFGDGEKADCRSS